MRYGIFSDVHSNLEALETVLSAMSKEKVEKYVCLGDIVGYAANPNECLDRVRQLPAVVVAGNHDSAAIGHPIIEQFDEVPREAVEWTATQLTEQNKAWIRTLPFVAQEGIATLVHGSLVEPEEFNYIYKRSEIEINFRLMKTPLCFIGHSHHPWIMEEGAPVAVSQMTCQGGKKYLVNVGSVGQPRDGDNRASFCIWDSADRRIELKRVAYDFQTTQQRILSAGLPAKFAERLAAGR